MFVAAGVNPRVGCFICCAPWWSYRLALDFFASLETGHREDVVINYAQHEHRGDVVINYAQHGVL